MIVVLSTTKNKFVISTESVELSNIDETLGCRQVLLDDLIKLLEW